MSDDTKKWECEDCGAACHDPKDHRYDFCPMSDEGEDQHQWALAGTTVLPAPSPGRSEAPGTPTYPRIN